jgi:hypothetical protein
MGNYNRHTAYNGTTETILHDNHFMIGSLSGLNLRAGVIAHLCLMLLIELMAGSLHQHQ